MLFFIPHIIGSKPLTSSNEEKPIWGSDGSTAGKCPIGSKTFRSYPCGTTNPWGGNKTLVEFSLVYENTVDFQNRRLFSP
ncbi:hypothetical protein GCM10008934_08840 [Virgibacillus salarius]